MSNSNFVDQCLSLVDQIVKTRATEIIEYIQMQGYDFKRNEYDSEDIYNEFIKYREKILKLIEQL